MIRVLPAVARFDDFAEIVGTRRPDARGCWCMSYRDSRVPAGGRPNYMRAECETEPGPGVLVYVDDVVAGWCSVAPRGGYRRLLRSRTITAPVGFTDDELWCAVCFVVRPGFRKRGLMGYLLTGAVEHASAHGARAVEGYPADTSERIDMISGYVGSVSLFERAGFERASPTTSRSGGAPRWVMRKLLR